MPQKGPIDRPSITKMSSEGGMLDFHDIGKGVVYIDGGVGKNLSEKKQEKKRSSMKKKLVYTSSMSSPKEIMHNKKLKKVVHNLQSIRQENEARRISQ